MNPKYVKHIVKRTPIGERLVRFSSLSGMHEGGNCVHLYWFDAQLQLELQTTSGARSHSSQTPVSCSTWRVRSAIINGTQHNVNMNGPQYWQKPLLRLRFFKLQYIKQLTSIIMNRVIPKDIQCPSFRAPADTPPLMSPITRAGQHHAPIRAGMLISNVKMEIHKVFCDSLTFSPPSERRGVSRLEFAPAYSFAALWDGGPQVVQSSSSIFPMLLLC